MFTEEELKRLNEALASDSSYSAVGFNYDGDASTENAQQAADNGTNISFIIALHSFWLDWTDPVELHYV